MSPFPQSGILISWTVSHERQSIKNIPAINLNHENVVMNEKRIRIESEKNICLTRVRLFVFIVKSQ